MEPLTHFLAGACIGRAGFNRKTAYATLVAVLAAEAADVDILWGFAGPVEELKHHRGITHTFVGAPVVAGVVVGAVWLYCRWRNRQPASRQPGGSARRQVSLPAVRWGWLYLTALVAALSHLLLDWTNNYGLRPFFPFNPRWYAGSFMFIAEPVLWAIFFLALAMPWLLGLTDREIGVRRQPFRGQGWAIFALIATAALGLWRWVEHTQGLAMLNQAQVAAAPLTRVALEPYPVNPYHWHAIMETPQFYQMAEVSTWNPSSPGAIKTDPDGDVIYKPADTPAVETAKRSFLGRVYLDWGTWAVVRDVGQNPIPGITPPELPPGRTWTSVDFTDLRFEYSFLPRRHGSTPLGGWAYIVDGREEAAEGMGRREQRVSAP